LRTRASERAGERERDECAPPGETAGGVPARKAERAARKGSLCSSRKGDCAGKPVSELGPKRRGRKVGAARSSDEEEEEEEVDEGRNSEEEEELLLLLLPLSSNSGS
jgi:hypothetical protein